MLAITIRAKSMVLGRIPGLMAQCTLVSGTRIVSKARENTHGRMAEYLKVTGLTTI